MKPEAAPPSRIEAFKALAPPGTTGVEWLRLPIVRPRQAGKSRRLRA